MVSGRAVHHDTGAFFWRAGGLSFERAPSVGRRRPADITFTIIVSQFRDYVTRYVIAGPSTTEVRARRPKKLSGGQMLRHP